AVAAGSPAAVVREGAAVAAGSPAAVARVAAVAAEDLEVREAEVGVGVGVGSLAEEARAAQAVAREGRLVVGAIVRA
ncbi:MAG TPA: hypothetical protein VFV36_09375, partial [Candidatus Methylomirabilis sp.]|nr:hypothetical protein [Candidatus Methylomirabilis sp.]